MHNCPDIITGWNIRLFDIPYLIKRTENILGKETVMKFSPFGITKYRQIATKGRDMDAYETYGEQQVDYYDLFTKFGYTYGNQASYSLDHIASVVLGEKKLSYTEHGSLFGLYKSDHQKFIDYNIKDVQLVDKIDKQTGLMDLALVIAYKGGVNYADTFGTTGIWDSIIYRYLYARQIAVPPTEHKHKDSYPGDYVKEPRVGMSEWVTSFDLNSLYPNLIVQYNMSPETLLNGGGDFTASGVGHYLENDLTEEARAMDVAVAANGSMYSKDKRGMLPEIIIGLYNERKTVKRDMIKLKQDYEKDKTADLEREINRLDNTQQAVKILLNSLYGALGNQYFRYFDLRIAEGITLSGQLSIKWAEKAMNEYLNKMLKSDEDYVIAIDTDSLYVDMNPLVKAVNPKDPVSFIDKACEEKIVPMLAKSYEQMNDRLNGFENRMVMAREAIADKGIWTAKKRYILNVHENEGVRYAEPKLKIMGIEAIKSATPMPCRTALKDIFKVIIDGDESKTQAAIKDFKDYFTTLPAHEIAFPRGVSKVKEYKDNEHNIQERYSYSCSR